MLDRFKAFFEDKGAAADSDDGGHTPDEFHLAAAALLVHAAWLMVLPPQHAGTTAVPRALLQASPSQVKFRMRQ